jgi:hypothetical protein
MRKKVLIVFPDMWVAFSPSTVNLYDALASTFDVTILAREPEYFSRQRLPNRKVEYVRISPFLRRVAGFGARLARKLGREVDPGPGLTAMLMLERARRLQPDIAIGVDFTGLWIAQQCCPNAHLLSLEANREQPFFEFVDRDKIASVIVQTQERFEYLFPASKTPRFLVQNAPVYTPLKAKPPRTNRLVFCGTAIPQFGILACLEFLNEYAQFSLTVHGAMPGPVLKMILANYRDLLASGRLILDRRYLELDEMPAYLSKFLVGFCLYDLTDNRINTFNYQTAPSGKLFSYYAAGVPVVCSNVRGLRSVVDFDAGVAIADLTPGTIYSAVQDVMARHAVMSENCLVAARHFSFDSAIDPFIAFLKDGP